MTWGVVPGRQLPETSFLLSKRVAQGQDLYSYVKENQRCRKHRSLMRWRARLTRPSMMYVADNLADWLPVSVMLDAGLTAGDNRCMDPQGLRALRDCGVTSIEVHVWWGLVESTSPGVYDWSAYRTLFDRIKEMGFQMQVFLCFHGNDNVMLPTWILEEGDKNPDIFFTDMQGGKYGSCLSLGVDSVPALYGRTAERVYADFMLAFAAEFRDMLGGCIGEVIVGLGPDGELRYPSHPQDGRWSFPGIGEFQCYDCYMRSTVQACAERSGNWDWGIEGGPHDAGSYCSTPQETDFFSVNGGWRTPYGKFFLQLYASLLLRHGHSILTAAVKLFSQHRVTVGAKIPLTHWWYDTPSHAAELTTGVYNTEDRDGYLPIVSMLADLGVSLHVAGADLRNEMQPLKSGCNPETLHAQIRACAAAFQVPIAVQNMSLMKKESWNQMLRVILDESRYGSINLPQVSAFVLNASQPQVLHPVFCDQLQHFISRIHGVCGSDWEKLDHPNHSDELFKSQNCSKPCSVP